MRLFAADVLKTLLFERMILIQGKEEVCLDLRDVLHCAGLPGPHRGTDTDRWTIPRVLSLVCDQQTEYRERIKQALSVLVRDHRQKKDAVTVYDQRTLALRKPIESCSKVIIVGQRVPVNRSQREMKEEVVTGFLKFASALADPGAKIPLPRSDGIFDADAVLGIVIGKRAERVSIAESLSYIAGFTLLIDITDRKTFETECKTNNNLMAKNRPNLSSLGPCIRMAPDVDSDHRIGLTFRLNGEVRQQFALEDLVYGIKEMVSNWSRLILEPGDMLGLGATLARSQPGKIFESPIPIKPGDVLEVESPTIGSLNVEMV